MLRGSRFSQKDSERDASRNSSTSSGAKKLPARAPIVAGQTMCLRAFPVELLDQMTMGDRGRHADIVQQAEIEDKARLFLPCPLAAQALGGHDADALAVCQIVDTDQIEGVGQGVDDGTEIGANGTMRGRCAHATIMHQSLPGALAAPLPYNSPFDLSGPRP